METEDKQEYSFLRVFNEMRALFCPSNVDKLSTKEKPSDYFTKRIKNVMWSTTINSFLKTDKNTVSLYNMCY